MKSRIILLAVLFMSSTLLSAQTMMNIHQSNGTVVQIPLNTIDSITYTISNPGNLASLNTVNASNLNATSATLGGNVLNDGGSTVTHRGVCYSVNPNPNTANDTTNNGSGIGSFSSNLSGLIANTTYYARAYAINSAGIAYGNEVSFTTTSIGNIATITTTSASNVDSTSATLGGNILASGGSSITQRGVCYSTTTNPTIANSSTNDGSAAGLFNSNLIGLTANTTYYVKAYAINSAGIAYGNEVSFTTLIDLGVAIGDSYQGGIIFYLDGLGGGLISAPIDQSTGSEWGCYGTLITGADAIAVGAGYQNTLDIEAECQTVGTAADVCANLTLGGYNDWYLPSKNEMYFMWANLADSDGDGNNDGPSDPNNLGGFANFAAYWTSTEASATNAWATNFTDGWQNTPTKGQNFYYVRAIRAF